MLSLFLCGDVMVGRSFNETFEQDPDFNIWGNIIDKVKGSDFFGINLETTITDNEEEFPNKMFNYKLSSKYKGVLTKGNVTYANLANNHSLDFKEEGLIETIKNLDSMNIEHTGAGKNIYEGKQPLIFEIKKVKIGILSSCDHPENFKATDRKAGINLININDIDKWDMYIKEVIDLKRRVDILIYSIHHGSNYVDIIPENTIIFFHKLVDNGVDVIHGHSAHHVLPIEKYKNSYIFYSMGDFIDDYAVDAYYRNDLSYLAKVLIEDGKLKSIKIYPTKITINYYSGTLFPQVNFTNENDTDYNFIITKTKYKNINIKGGSLYKYKYHKYKYKYKYMILIDELKRGMKLTLTNVENYY